MKKQMAIEETIKLYHGGFEKVRKPSLNSCNTGFFTTDSRYSAVEFALKFDEEMGRIVSVYELKNIEKLNIVEVDFMNNSYDDFDICENYDESDKIKSQSSVDKMVELIIRENMGIDILVARNISDAGEIANNYVFTSNKGLKSLKFVEAFEPIL